MRAGRAVSGGVANGDESAPAAAGIADQAAAGAAPSPRPEADGGQAVAQSCAADTVAQRGPPSPP